MIASGLSWCIMPLEGSVEMRCAVWIAHAQPRSLDQALSGFHAGHCVSWFEQTYCSLVSPAEDSSYKEDGLPGDSEEWSRR